MVSQTTFSEYKRHSTEQFNNYKATKTREFEEYRTRVNNEFAEYMGKTWSQFKTEPAEPVVPTPEPPTPIVADPDANPSNDPIPFTKVIPLPKTEPKPQPLLPQQRPDEIIRPTILPTIPTINFDFYGYPCVIPFDPSLKLSLKGTDEKSVADAWKQLSGKASVALISGAIDIRDSLNLCDWGYLRFVERLAEAVHPDNRNEAALLQMFILTQSGYKVRIGRCNERLAVLIPCNEVIYQYSYTTINGTKYYIIDRNIGKGSINIYTRNFPGEQMLSLAIEQQPSLPQNLLPPRRFISKRDNRIDISVETNKNIIDFFNDYPLSSHWNIYANASLSDVVKNQLYTVLRQKIEGKSKTEAANILLHFVQTAFEYKTDDEQFGYERSFFPDETFYYPYSDCEDRAILYSTLIRELLGLDVVLLYYPGHLATAVCFNEEVNGDYLNIDGNRYTVCDPTYINANIGMTMNQFKSTPAEVIKL